MQLQYSLWNIPLRSSFLLSHLGSHSLFGIETQSSVSRCSVITSNFNSSHYVWKSLPHCTNKGSIEKKTCTVETLSTISVLPAPNTTRYHNYASCLDNSIVKLTGMCFMISKETILTSECIFKYQ